MSQSKIWRVYIQDLVYKGVSVEYFVLGDTAASAEAKGLKLYKKRDKELTAGESRHEPQVRQVEFVGELEA